MSQAAHGDEQAFLTTRVRREAGRRMATADPGGRRRPFADARRRALKHDPEKWEPVFGSDHAQTKGQALEFDLDAVESNFKINQDKSASSPASPTSPGTRRRNRAVRSDARRRSGRRSLLAGGGPARGRRPASGKGFGLRRGAACFCRPMTRPRRWHGSAPWSRAMRRASWSRSATVFMMAAARRGCPMATARCCGALQRGRDWLWIAGNHDPEPGEGIGGCLRRGCRSGAEFPPRTDGRRRGEIAGHLHPVARVAGRGGAVRSRCFAADARCLVMPAFGAYAGGLNVRDRAFARVFETLSFTATCPGRGPPLCGGRATAACRTGSLISAGLIGISMTQRRPSGSKPIRAVP